MIRQYPIEYIRNKKDQPDSSVSLPARQHPQGGISMADPSHLFMSEQNAECTTGDEQHDATDSKKIITPTSKYVGARHVVGARHALHLRD